MQMSGISGGLDSLFEYLNKASIAFNNEEFQAMFEQVHFPLCHFWKQK
jgi:hypothetical protein